MSDEPLVLREPVPLMPTLVASVGALGEVLLLRQDLVDSHPYIMLTYPPGSFYETLANVASPILFVAAVLIARLLPARRVALAPVVIATATPLAYLVILFGMTAACYGFSVPADVRNFDGYTVARATAEFARFALILATAGLVVGGTCSAVLAHLLERRPSPLERSA